MHKYLVTAVENGSTDLDGVHPTHAAVDNRDPGMNQLQAPPTNPSLPLLDAHGACPVPHLLQVARRLPPHLPTPAESHGYIMNRILTALSGSSPTARVGALDGAEMAACSVL